MMKHFNRCDCHNHSNTLLEITRANLVGKTKVQSPERVQRSKDYRPYPKSSKIDVDKLILDDVFVVHVPVGKYIDTIEFDGVLYTLIQLVKRQTHGNVNLRVVTSALQKAIDHGDLKLNCTCPDWCLHPNTEIKLLNGEVHTVEELYNTFNSNTEMYVYSSDRNGDFKPGKVKDIWISGYTQDMIKVTLDNGKSIITTPNHAYMLRNGEYIEAQNLSVGQSLMPLYFSYHNGYECVKLNSSNSTIFKSVYKLVADELLQEQINAARCRTDEDIVVIHHKDYNKSNNYPSNLYPMGKLEHWKFHANHTKESGALDKFIAAGRHYWDSPEGRQRKSNEMRESMRRFREGMTVEEWKNYNEVIHAWQKTPEGHDKLSHSLKTVWENYDEDQYKQRCEINRQNNIKSKEKQIIARKQYWVNLLPEERQRRADLSAKVFKEYYATHSITEKQRKARSLNGKKHAASLTSKQRSKIGKLGAIASRISAHTPEANAKRAKTEHANWLNKLANLPENERNAKLVEYTFNHNKDKRYPNASICLGKIKCTLYKLAIMGMPLTEANYIKYRNAKSPKIDTIYNYYDSWEDMLKQYDLLQFNHRIVSIEYMHYDEPIPVYDLEIADYHNFYVNAGVLLHNCYRYRYWSTRYGYCYGMPETRPAKIRNPHDNIGAMCKHLTAILNNKRWLVQLASKLNYIIQSNIEKIREAYGLKESDFYVQKSGVNLRYQNKDNAERAPEQGGEEEIWDS